MDDILCKYLCVKKKKEKKNNKTKETFKGNCSDARKPGDYTDTNY